MLDKVRKAVLALRTSGRQGAIAAAVIAVSVLVLLEALL